MQNKPVYGIEKIVADLAWRGPNDKPMGHVVLTRAQADEVLTEIERLRSLMLMDAGRYWEGRWRDADVEVKRLRAALDTCRELREYDAADRAKG